MERTTRRLGGPKQKEEQEEAAAEGTKEGCRFWRSGSRLPLATAAWLLASLTDRPIEEFKAHTPEKLCALLTAYKRMMLVHLKTVVTRYCKGPAAPDPALLELLRALLLADKAKKEKAEAPLRVIGEETPTKSNVDCSTLLGLVEAEWRATPKEGWWSWLTGSARSVWSWLTRSSGGGEAVTMSSICGLLFLLGRPKLLEESMRASGGNKLRLLEFGRGVLLPLLFEIKATDDSGVALGTLALSARAPAILAAMGVPESSAERLLADLNPGNLGAPSTTTVERRLAKALGVALGSLGWAAVKLGLRVSVATALVATGVGALAATTGFGSFAAPLAVSAAQSFAATAGPAAAAAAAAIGLYRHVSHAEKAKTPTPPPPKPTSSEPKPPNSQRPLLLTTDAPSSRFSPKKSSPPRKSPLPTMNDRLLREPRRTPDRASPSSDKARSMRFVAVLESSLRDKRAEIAKLQSEAAALEKKISAETGQLKSDPAVEKAKSKCRKYLCRVEMPLADGGTAVHAIRSKQDWRRWAASVGHSDKNPRADPAVWSRVKSCVDQEAFCLK